jgi:2,4-dienoyl-CoA reductase (NADPH2)
LIGAGGIGFDVAEFLAHPEGEDPTDTDTYLATWGIDRTLEARGGLVERKVPTAARQITLCQRSYGKLGANLGKTTGWIHRTSLKQYGVEMLAECAYDRIDEQGLHLTVAGEPRVLEVDDVVICAGQEPLFELEAPLSGRGIRTYRIGGADVAAELDAKRAIAQGARVATDL